MNDGLKPQPVSINPLICTATQDEGGLWSLVTSSRTILDLGEEASYLANTVGVHQYRQHVMRGGPTYPNAPVVELGRQYILNGHAHPRLPRLSGGRLDKLSGFVCVRISVVTTDIYPSQGRL